MAQIFLRCGYECGVRKPFRPNSTHHKPRDEVYSQGVRLKQCLIRLFGSYMPHDTCFSRPRSSSFQHLARNAADVYRLMGLQPTLWSTYASRPLQHEGESGEDGASDSDQAV